jgi:glycosyltransferase involved in cell wall biosynthesis
MKVAFVSFDYPEYTHRVAHALAARCDVLLVQPRLHAEAFLRSDRPRLTVWTFDKPRLRQPWRQLRTIRAILRRIREFAPEVVHVQSGHAWFHLALPMLRDCPVVVTIHDVLRHVGDRDSQKTPQWVADFGHRCGDHVIVHSERIRRLALGRLRIPAAHVHVVPHVALGSGGGASVAAEEPGPVLFFGRIWGYKGLEYLIRAEPAITASVPDARIVVAGEGESFERYAGLMVHPERFVVVNRFIPDRERDELFRRASVVVLPYVEASQSGVVPLAYTFGKPVVATDVGGLPDMVEHGRTGYVVPSRDVPALAEAIVTLLKNRDLRQTFGQNARHIVETSWSAATVADLTLGVYRAACNSGRRGGLLQRVAS